MKTCTKQFRLPMLAATAAGLAIATAANAQVLYNNGPLKTGTATESGVVAPGAPAVEWSENQHDAGNTTQFNSVLGFSDNYDSPGAQLRLADNFTVPSGQIWNVTSVCLYGYKTGALTPPSPFDAYNLAIWNGRPGDFGAVVVFGDTVTNRMVSSTDFMAFRIGNTIASTVAPGTTRRLWQSTVSTLSGVATGTPLALAPGTYWVDWASSDTANGAHFNPPLCVLGTRSLPGWNGRQFQGGSTNTWTDLVDGGNPTTAPDIIMDVPFQVKGALGNNCLIPLPFCAADVFPPGGDGVVNIDDLVQGVINNFGQTGPPRPIGDCFPLPNGDCLVNIDDLIQGVINHWGPCPPPTGACCTGGVCVNGQSAAACNGGGGTYMGDGTSCANVVCPSPPPNDNCASRIVVTNGMNNWNNANSNNDGPAVACADPVNRDVWFNYVATCTGHVTFDTLGTAAPFTDTVIAVYAGNSCAPLGALLGCNDDASSSTFLSSLSIELNQGDVVKIRCMSHGTTTANQGAAKLNIACVLFNNDICADATGLTIGQSINGSLQGATQDQGAICNGVSVGAGRWYKVNGNGNNLRVSTCGSPLETWDGRLSVYCGNTFNSCDTQTCVNGSATYDCDPSGSTQTGLHERLDWCSKNGQVYYILVHVDVVPLPPEGLYSLIVTDLGTTCSTSLLCGPQLPLNDDCAGAFSVGNGGNPGISNILATTSAGIPGGVCVGAGNFFTKDVWYNYTATGTGNTIFSLCTSTPQTDSSMAVLTGDCGALTEVGCDDDFCGGASFSQATIATTMGTVYRIRVGMWSSTVGGGAQNGAMVLTITAPP